ncbi:transmembrane emp24 domain-containing protein, putative [Plasmodium gallinaceum]|uniref:Transmembrane emp24 domain-containing protein, putative n=1 Tax=Plasmodium gallinaceum TaxID=5849 RepID=A0A1J1GKX5_PLAGA|nr:transmembrane emp24 domain-containing protein, putative [Plasmodium gallinaceum]CRG93038.1 transmembrane emp24 domain-containing protein, putative [Plasmodium gallinaceum]
MKGIKTSGIVFLLFFSIFLISSNVKAAYFYVKEGVDKCFVESVASNIVITSSYDNYGLKDVKCLINIKDQNGRVLYSHETSKITKGKISYLTNKDGLYYICISCPSTNWFKSTSIKWTLSIDVGGTDIDLENLAKKSELSETLSILKSLKKKFNSMKLQQGYQKHMATNLHEYNESVHKKMFYCYITEIILLILITIYSIVHLKNYFKSQKLM